MSRGPENRTLTPEEVRLDRDILSFIQEIVVQHIGPDKPTKPAEKYEKVEVHTFTSGLNEVIRGIDITQTTWRTTFRIEETGKWLVRGETSPDVPEKPRRPWLEYGIYGDREFVSVGGRKAIVGARKALGMEQPEQSNPEYYYQS